MFVLINLLDAVVYALGALLYAYSIVVVAVCLISFVNPDPYNPVVRLLRTLTEPALWRIRKYLPFTYTGTLDFSPLVLLILIQMVRIGVINSLHQLVYSLQ